MIEESKCCADMMKKHYNEKLVMAKADGEDFETFTKHWICDNAYVEGDVKVRDHYHVTGKYRFFSTIYRVPDGDFKA